MRHYFPLVVLFGAGLSLAGASSSPAEDAPSKEKIDRLIDQLGSGTFTEREKATKELAKIGLPALDGLRKAVKSDDPEVRRRAEELLPRIEIQVESIQQLAPRRVHLTYKDTPISEAVADFQKKSRYAIALHDPGNKLKERKVTLDSGEATFWHALELFCDKAGVVEAARQEVLPALRPPQPGPIPPVRIRPAPAAQAAPLPPPGQPMPAQRVQGGGVVFQARATFVGNPWQIYLKDGKLRKRPTDDRTAVRVRVLDKSDRLTAAGRDEYLLPLEISAEPKLQWELFRSLRIDKAVDDQDQSLTQIVPQINVPAPNGAGVLPAIANQARPGLGAPLNFGIGLSQHVPAYLKKGTKESRTLKEFKGVITTDILAESKPYITAENLAKSIGKTFKGDVGGSIRILTVTEEDKKTVLRFEFEQPPPEKIRPATAQAGMPVMKALPPPPPPVPGGAVPPVAAPAVAVPRFTGPINGLCIRDDKGRDLPLEMGPMELRRQILPGGALTQQITYTITCPRDKEQGKPATIVYLGRKRVTVEIPFALQDVPLP